MEFKHGKVLTCSTKSIAVDFGHAKSHRDLWTASAFSEISNDLPIAVHMAFVIVQVAIIAGGLTGPSLQIIFIQSHEQKTRTRIRNTSR
jgi:hypothetical protein